MYRSCSRWLCLAIRSKWVLVLLRHTRGLGFCWLLFGYLPHFVEVHWLKWPISAWKPLWIKTSQPLNVTGAAGLGAGGKIMGPWDLRGGSILYGKAPSLWIFFVIKDPMALVQRFFRRQQDICHVCQSKGANSNRLSPLPGLSNFILIPRCMMVNAHVCPHHFHTDSVMGYLKLICLVEPFSPTCASSRMCPPWNAWVKVSSDCMDILRRYSKLFHHIWPAWLRCTPRPWR